MGAGGGDLPYGMINFSLASVKLADVNRDREKDVVVRIMRARIPPSPALDARVRRMCEKTLGHAKLMKLLPRMTETSLEFISNGQTFTPSPATAQKIQTWTHQSPSQFNGVLAYGPPLPAP
jgi:hypothetical protein